MRLLVLSAAFLMACVSAGAVEHHENADTDIFAALQTGGYALVMRHANSPGGQKASVGLSSGCELAPGRGLDAEGLYQARAMGEILRENEVVILKAYTSRMCRAWDTAALTAGGAPVESHASQVSTDGDVVAAFKADVAAELAANPGQNIILSSHSNIAPLYGATARADEEEVPSGVVYVVDPEDWHVVARIDLVAKIEPASVAVE